MNEHIKAGAEIHAGGGYREGTQEEYEAFMKVRNKSLAENRIKELIKQASYSITETNGAPIISNEFNIEKFVELIVKECAQVAYDTYWSNPKDVRGWHISESIKQHFGVE